LHAVVRRPGARDLLPGRGPRLLPHARLLRADDRLYVHPWRVADHGEADEAGRAACRRAPARERHLAAVPAVGARRARADGAVYPDRPVTRRILVGFGAVALVVLSARTLAYRAVPDPSARFFEHRAGGPAVPMLALVALAICAVLAVTLCWLVAVGVRERALIARREPARFAVGTTFVTAALLALATCFVGGVLEADLHWRAGLGWHGLPCLFGPVHRDLIPFETGLSFVAAAVIAAVGHVVTWMRSTFARLAADLPAFVPGTLPAFGEATAVRVAARASAASARAPPLPGWPDPATKGEQRMHRFGVFLAVLGCALAVAASASAHAAISPAVALTKHGQLFTLAVPTEKENATTTKVELTPPDGFAIDSLVPAPGWTRDVKST